MIPLVAVGLALGLDSFQVSLGAGLLKLSNARQVVIALAFGASDGVATLAGLAMSRSLSGVINSSMGLIGTVLIAGYGLYTIVVAKFRWRSPSESSEKHLALVTVGIPICLSIDNLAVGVGLGMLDYPLLLSAATLAAMSTALSFAGVKLGRTVGNQLPFKAEFVSGIVLLIVATLRVAE